jgi:hypothetical protein
MPPAPIREMISYGPRQYSRAVRVRFRAAMARISADGSFLCAQPGPLASVTKPTPRCSSSCSVAHGSVTERPQRSSRHTSTKWISRRRAVSSGRFLASSFCRFGVHLAHLHGNHPAAPDGIFPQGAVLNRQSLLVLCGAQHFRRSVCLAKTSWYGSVTNGSQQTFGPAARRRGGSISARLARR